MPLRVARFPTKMEGMDNERVPRVARINVGDLAEMSSAWTNQERGQYLRLLLQGRGIDPDQLFRLEYYPQRRCWLLIQNARPGHSPRPPQPPGQADERFYVQTITDFRRTARTAFSALAAQSTYFASYGCKYQLPAKPQEISPASLSDLLGGPGSGDPDVRFDSEGGWWNEPSAN